MVGIDLGTTYSAVAVVGSAGRPEIIPNAEGERITPSVVQIGAGGATRVGAAALRSAVAAPLDVVQFVKRQMGNPSWRHEASDGTQHSPEQVSALVLAKLKRDAESYLGAPVTDAVITVPAFFDEARRRATIEAGRAAGLNVARVINEPTAAALAFGVETAASGNVVVFDLGGGTFDVTVLHMAGGVFDVLGTDGLHELGGFEWDNRLMRLLNEEFKAAGGPDLLDTFEHEAELREKAELAKRSLSNSPMARVALSAKGISKVLGVSRERFERETADLLNQTRDLTDSLIEEVGLSWPQIDGILLVGGSTRMPMVRHMLERLGDRPILRGGNPDELVALGAAIQASLESPSGPAVRSAGGPALQVRDVTSHGLGTIALDDQERTRNYVLLPRNTKIPAKRSMVFDTATDRQREVRIIVTEGDETDPRYVTRLGPPDGQVFPIPPQPAGVPIEVTFAYDVDQLIHVQVTHLPTRERVGTFEVEPEAADEGRRP